MGGAILAGDQAGELGQHPGQSRSGDRHDGCRGVGRCGCERAAAHIRWLTRRTGPGGPDNWLPRHTDPGRPDQRRDLREESCGRPGHDGCSGQRGCPHIRRCEAVPDLRSALSLRVVPGPALAFAFAFAVAQALEIALALALVLALADGLRPMAT